MGATASASGGELQLPGERSSLHPRPALPRPPSGEPRCAAQGGGPEPEPARPLSGPGPGCSRGLRDHFRPAARGAGTSLAGPPPRQLRVSTHLSPSPHPGLGCPYTCPLSGHLRGQVSGRRKLEHSSWPSPLTRLSARTGVSHLGDPGQPVGITTTPTILCHHPHDTVGPQALHRQAKRSPGVP